MRIRRLRIDGFSNLRGEFIFSNDRCNLVLEPNESGKSTLAAAIIAALYGFPRQRASKERQTQRERYRPWAGGPYAVEIEVECRDAAWIVRRDFENDLVAIHDAVSGRNVTEQFAASRDQIQFGEKITLLSREDFARCCFVGQGELSELGDAAGLTHAMQKVASTQRGDMAAGEAIEILRRAVETEYRGRMLAKGKVSSEIRRLEKEMDEVRAEMEAIRLRRRESEEKIRALERATASEGRAEEDLARIDYLQAVAACDEAVAGLFAHTRDEEEVARLRSEQESLVAFAAFPGAEIGRLREMKGKIESLKDLKQTMVERIEREIDPPIEAARQELATTAGFDALDAIDVTAVGDRHAVLMDLWRQRREKRAATRTEERRLKAMGIDPARVTLLGGALAGLSDADRAFLSGYREADLEKKAALAEVEALRARLQQAESIPAPILGPFVPARRGEILALAVGFLGIVLTAVLWFAIESKLPGAILLLVALAGFVQWIRLQERRPVPGAEQFGTDLQRAQTDGWTREKDVAAMRERLSGMASQVGRVSGEILLEEYRELSSLQERAAALVLLAAGLREIEVRYASVAEELQGTMHKAGWVAGRRPVTPAIARRFRDLLERHTQASQRVSRFATDRDDLVREIAGVGIEIESFNAMLQTIIVEAFRSIGEAAIPEPFDSETALKLFEEAATRRERFERVGNELLPAATGRTHLSPADQAARSRKEIEILKREIEAGLAAFPSLTTLRPELSSREYGDMRRRAQEEIRASQKAREALSFELGDVLREYRRDYPGRQTALAGLESAFTRAVAFRDSITIAVETLTAISREAYAEWAQVLNEKASAILKRLAPRYEDIRFDTDLRFTVRDAVTGARRDQHLVDAAFSAGARDQIYLAIRVAVSEYLSGPDLSLPFVLDDPFTTFDDERFDSAMEFLLDTLARRHQIIALSCHTLRHQNWQTRTSVKLGDRVRILDLTPLST